MKPILSIPSYRVLVVSKRDELMHDIYCSSFKFAEEVYYKMCEGTCKGCAIWSKEHGKIIMKTGIISEGLYDSRM